MKNAETPRYCLYFLEDGMCSKLMTLKEAIALRKEFIQAYIVDAKTAEVID